ncbi:MAG: glycoside hydrolase family 30 protein [Bacteroidales bacterium]|nr:glycoside hydrolase family 30 protein [Candidatus Colicola faecequi]
MKKILYCAAALVLASCGGVKSSQVLVTSEAGDKCANGKTVVFRVSDADDAIVINTEDKRQTIDGFGGSLTESSAFVLACLTPEERQAILRELFSEDGANFTLTRTQIGASDFSVEGKYSLCEEEGDVEMRSFSLDRDKEGFSKEKYPRIKDEHYDLYHLMMDVKAIKESQPDPTLRIIANTWTAPAWMKDNKLYYERQNGIERGGLLLKEYYQAYADYLACYLRAYRQEGVEIWAMSPVNEPQGNGGGWESMDMSPEVEADFIGKYMGPTLEREGFGHVKILGFDQNIGEVLPYADAIYNDSLAAAYTPGIALHWYGDTKTCMHEYLDALHEAYPEKFFIHTEGCIDNLGCSTGWDAVQDKEGYQEHDFFGNDSFWWNELATDWAYSTPQGETHPKYAAVHRYAAYIIDGMNHWMTGFADWNIVLDEIGGPNHVQNFCGAEVMVNAEEGVIYYTPYYYALKQLSLSMRPGDRVLGVSEPIRGELHLCAVEKADGSYAINMLNTSKEAIDFKLRIGEYVAEVNAPANSVQTIMVSL